MTPRYVIRPDPEGFTITDIWTGQPAVLATLPQTGLSQADADHTADLLNRTPAERDATASRRGRRDDPRDVRFRRPEVRGADRDPVSGPQGPGSGGVRLLADPPIVLAASNSLLALGMTGGTTRRPPPVAADPR
jgi:hypothetical protein